MGGSDSVFLPPTKLCEAAKRVNDKFYKLNYYMADSMIMDSYEKRGYWRRGGGRYICGDMAVFIRRYFERISSNDRYYLNNLKNDEFKGRFNKIKGNIKLKIDENTSWTYYIDRILPYRLLSIEDEYFRETSDSMEKYDTLVNSLTKLMDTLSKIYDEVTMITSSKREHIIERANKISELLETLRVNNDKLLFKDFKEILNYRRIATLIVNDNNTGWGSRWRWVLRYNLVAYLNSIYHRGNLYKLTNKRSENRYEFETHNYYNTVKNKIKNFKNEIVKDTNIEQNIKDYRKVIALVKFFLLNNSWSDMPVAEDLAQKYLTLIFNICSELISILKDFTINKINNNMNIDDSKLIDLADILIIKLVPNIIQSVTLEIGKNNKYNSVLESLRTLQADYKKLKVTMNKFNVLQVFNQRYKFKCEKFGNKYHMILSFNEQKYKQYLLNPNDEFKINSYPYSPSIYEEGIGPLCVKQKNEKGYRSLERCYDYESKQRCESNLNSIDKTTTSATFKKQLIDTIKGISVYESSAQLFNPNSKLHNKEFNNCKRNDVKELNEKPNIIKTKPITTTTTTTEYIHKEIIRQPPETTQAKLLELPDPIIPDGNYYVSIVDKNGSEKYVNVFKKEINNKIYYFLKTVNQDTTKDQSTKDKLKNNSIFTVRNKSFPDYYNSPYNFITIEFKVANNNNQSNQSTYFLRTENDTNKVIITNKDTDNDTYTDIEKSFNWYFLPENINESPNENGPIEVYLKPITEDLEDYCYLNDDNEIESDDNLQQIKNDATINHILNILLNNDEDLPIIRCNSEKPLSNRGEPISYFKFERKEN